MNKLLSAGAAALTIAGSVLADAHTFTQVLLETRGLGKPQPFVARIRVNRVAFGNE